MSNLFCISTIVLVMGILMSVFALCSSQVEGYHSTGCEWRCWVLRKRW